MENLVIKIRTIIKNDKAERERERERERGREGERECTCRPLYLISSFSRPTTNIKPSSSTVAISPKTDIHAWIQNFFVNFDNVFFFLVDEGRENPSTTISGPSSARQQNAIKWRFAGVLMIAQR